MDKKIRTNFEPLSPWTNFLNPSIPDPYYAYKDNLSLKMEQIILATENELLASNKEFTKQAARQLAICLMMEQMLSIQYEYSPESLQVMTISLFSDLPEVKDFRLDFFEKAFAKGQQSKTNIFSKFFSKFRFKK